MVKKPMHLAICNGVQAFAGDRLSDRQWSRRFPGSGWISCLYQEAPALGVGLASGDVALANVQSGKWKAQDVLVIQERVSVEGTKLLDAGASPFLVTCLEAPLYAPFFYDEIFRIAADFKFSMGFGFSRTGCGNATSGKDIQFRFPSFYLEDIRSIRPWHDREKIVLVAANKYRTSRMYIPARPTPYNLLRQLKAMGWRITSPAFRHALRASLHDKRLEAVNYFARKQELALFGSGWDDWDMLPSYWSVRLQSYVQDQYRGLCDDKLETISAYRFSLCIENMVMPGYLTEKMIDCFTAGTIPLYLGAPDIDELVPSEAFVDLRNFESYQELDEYLNAFDECRAEKMMAAGREYLRTKMGMLHSYEGFAEKVLGLVREC